MQTKIIKQDKNNNIILKIKRIHALMMVGLISYHETSGSFVMPDYLSLINRLSPEQNLLKIKHYFEEIKGEITKLKDIITKYESELNKKYDYVYLIQEEVKKSFNTKDQGGHFYIASKAKIAETWIAKEIRFCNFFQERNPIRTNLLNSYEINNIDNYYKYDITSFNEALNEVQLFCCDIITKLSSGNIQERVDAWQKFKQETVDSFNKTFNQARNNQEAQNTLKTAQSVLSRFKRGIIRKDYKLPD